MSHERRRRILYNAAINSVTPLLDIITTASAAYSLRRLRTAYTGPCIRLYRTADAEVRDIGFSGNGFVDLAAAAAFIGASTGQLYTWYDQSGNGVDMASNQVNGAMPVFSSSGGPSGKPTFTLDGSNDYKYTDIGAPEAPLTIMALAYFEDLNQQPLDFDYVTALGPDGGIPGSHLSIVRFAEDATDGDKYYSYDGTAAYTGPVLTGEQWNVFVARHLTSAPRHNLMLNGATQSVNDYPTSIGVLGGELTMGSYSTGGSAANFFHGRMSELVVWPSSVDVAAVSANVNAAWGAY